MDVVANGLLAFGASPAMVHAEEEVADFVAIADALVVNIGTLSAPWVRSMRRRSMLRQAAAPATRTGTGRSDAGSQGKPRGDPQPN
mgnify:CR=1 FL=1